MTAEVVLILKSLEGLPLFDGVEITDVNVLDADGSNALHYVVRRDDVAAATVLIDAGINMNQRGDLGRTPLHEACASGNVEIVKLLVERGADLFAMAEGDAPFTTARLNGHDQICELLRPYMTDAQAKVPQIWVRTQIQHLQRVIRRLEQLLHQSEGG